VKKRGVRLEKKGKSIILAKKTTLMGREKNLRQMAERVVPTQRKGVGKGECISGSEWPKHGASRRRWDIILTE